MKKMVFLALLMALPFNAYAQRVGLLIMATGRYIEFVEPLLASADRYFLPEDEVVYFIFTDQNIDFYNRIMRPIVRIEQARLGWPHDTLMRLPIYYQHIDLYENLDYLYALDADMLFVDTVGSEILGERVATQHPGYVGQRGTYETNPRSRACIRAHEGQHYFAGGFNGGSKDEFMRMARTIAEAIEADFDNNIIAIWHDESHINRWFVDNQPTVILTPSYCYPGAKYIPYHKRLVALDKNHSEYRAD